MTRINTTTNWISPTYGITPSSLLQKNITPLSSGASDSEWGKKVEDMKSRLNNLSSSVDTSQPASSSPNLAAGQFSSSSQSSQSARPDFSAMQNEMQSVMARYGISTGSSATNNSNTSTQGSSSGSSSSGTSNQASAGTASTAPAQGSSSSGGGSGLTLMSGATQGGNIQASSSNSGIASILTQQNQGDPNAHYDLFA